MSVNMYISNIERLSRDIAGLETQLGRERDKLARLNSDIGNIQRGITSSTSTSTLRYKQQQIESKLKEIAQVQKRIGDIESKLTTKRSEQNRNTQNLDRMRQQEQKKQAQEQNKQVSEAKKRREEELRHTKEITREIERQSFLHRSMQGKRFIIDVSKLPVKIKVLFFASNPLDQEQLRLDEEIRSIQEKIRASEYRESVELISRWAVRPDDLLQALNEHMPNIVHFSGHGDADVIVFSDDQGNTKLVDNNAIVQLMRAVNDNIRVVLFNTCFSRNQAEAVVQHVDVAIGMNSELGDEAARVFAAQFYSAIGFGRSVQNAFDQAKTALMLRGIREEDTPELFTREGVVADEIILVRPDGASLTFFEE